MTDFTPGPWEDATPHAVHREEEWHAIINQEGKVIATVNQGLLWPKGYDWTPEEVRANARALRAAPELVAACEGVLAIVKTHGDNYEELFGVYPPGYHTAITALEAVLAQVKGEGHEST